MFRFWHIVNSYTPSFLVGKLILFSDFHTNITYTIDLPTWPEQAFQPWPASEKLISLHHIVYLISLANSHYLLPVLEYHMSIETFPGQSSIRGYQNDKLRGSQFWRLQLLQKQIRRKIILESLQQTFNTIFLNAPFTVNAHLPSMSQEGMVIYGMISLRFLTLGSTMSWGKLSLDRFQMNISNTCRVGKFTEDYCMVLLCYWAQGSLT